MTKEQFEEKYKFALSIGCETVSREEDDIKRYIQRWNLDEKKVEETYNHSTWPEHTTLERCLSFIKKKKYY